VKSEGLKVGKSALTTKQGMERKKRKRAHRPDASSETIKPLMPKKTKVTELETETAAKGLLHGRLTSRSALVREGKGGS